MLVRKLDDGKGTSLVIALLVIGMLTVLFVAKEQSASQSVSLGIVPRYQNLGSLDDVVPLNDTLVEPVIYANIAGLNALPTQAKKDKFIAIMLPTILLVKKQWAEKQQFVQNLMQDTTLSWSTADSLMVDSLMQKLKASSLGGLNERLKTHPTSLVLAQAAIESGWGTSRFFTQANNIFGVWSYNSKEPRMKASETRGEKPVYVKKYDFIATAVNDYFTVIARAPAYRKFRKARAQSNNPYQLIWYLRNYSELRDRYIVLLGKTITGNALEQYDHYRLKPSIQVASF